MSKGSKKSPFGGKGEKVTSIHSTGRRGLWASPLWGLTGAAQSRSSSLGHTGSWQGQILSKEQGGSTGLNWRGVMDVQSDCHLSPYLCFLHLCAQIMVTVVPHELKNKLTSPGYIEDKGETSF